MQYSTALRFTQFGEYPILWLSLPKNHVRVGLKSNGTKEKLFLVEQL